MSTKAIISEILAMPEDAQLEILSALRARLAGADDLELSPEDERELDRRIDRFEREGSQGESWAVVENRLRGMLANARRDAN